MKRAVVRLPSEVVDRLDILAEKLRALRPRKSFSRAAVARALIASGLEVAEAEGAEGAQGAEGEGAEK